jgi:hypothetical protein
MTPRNRLGPGDHSSHAEAAGGQILVANIADSTAELRSHVCELAELLMAGPEVAS